MKKISDSEILSNVLETIRYAAPEFSEKLGYKSPSSIYNVIKENGGAKISIAMAERIVEVFPEVNYLYLTRGQKPILVNKDASIGQSHILGWNKNEPTFNDIPKTLKSIEALLKEIRDKMCE